jgi:transcriptional regulator with XRE-family HTH domain
VGRGLDGFNPSALYELRLRRGLTQAQLARRIGVRQANISSLERGVQRPTVRTAHALAVALGVRANALFFDPPANLLIRLRLSAGVTQRQAADLLGLPVSSYAELEQPAAAVPSEIASTLASSLNLPRGLLDDST